MRDVKRIVFITPLGGLGGAERSLLAWMRATRVTWPDASLTLLLLGPGPLVEAARDAGIAVHVIPMPRQLAAMGDSRLSGARASALGSFASLARLGARAVGAGPSGLRYVRALRQAMHRLEPDLIHSNGIKTHLLTRLTRSVRRENGGAPALVWHLHDFIGQRPLMARALRRASAGVDLAIAVSQAVALDAQTILPNTPVTIVYNTTDICQFTPTGAQNDQPLDQLAGMPAAPAGTIRIALVATYAKWKGHDVFLQAAGKAIAMAPALKVRFYIVGGAIYRTTGSQFSEQELRGHAVQLGISQHVGFVPFQQDPASTYCAADIVVHASSKPEPFGLTIVEAMACGRPVIVSMGGGAAELFTDGKDAIGVPPGDPAALAQAIVRLASDPELRARLGSVARATASARFDSVRLPQQVLEAYQPLFDRRARRESASE